jgi:hypothetical protein
MRSVTYTKVKEGVAAMAGIDPTSILSHENVLLAEYINDAVKYCWDYYPWAEFTKTEVRYFRDQYDPTTIYSPDQEVYYQGKYYRTYLGAGAGVLPTDVRNWVEVGDVDAAPDWSETGVYFIGAKVKYNDKLYLVPNESEQPDIPYCFEIDGKLPDQFFTELDETFDRFIAYEQTGKDVIGTCLSITLDDPRYNDTTPLNWREDREGIYIEPYEKSFNQVWLRYRLEAPTFTSQSNSEEVPNFLTPAIKVYAYKAFLIADGQHEKAQLQDIYGLDLLVRELDKLDMQQDRAAPFTITKEPYRRLNAKQNAVAPVTADKIGALKSATITSSVSISSNSFAKNAVVKAYIVGDPIFTLIVFAENMVRKGFPACHLRVKSIVKGINAVKYGIAESVSRIRTGKAYRSINFGQVRGLKLRLVLSPPISTSVTMKLTSQGRNVVRSSAVQSMPIAVTLNSNGRNVVRSGRSTIPVKVCFKYDQVVGRNLVRKGTSVMPLGIGSDFTGRNVVQRGSATSSLQFQSTFIGKNAVKKAIPTAIVSISSTFLYRRVRHGSATSQITYTITNDGDSSVQLFNTRTTPQTDAFLDGFVEGYFANSSHKYIWFEAHGQHTSPMNGNTPYVDQTARRLAHIETSELFNRNQQFKLVHVDDFKDEVFFDNLQMDYRDLPFNQADSSGFSWFNGSATANNPTSQQPYEKMLLINKTPVNVFLPATNSLSGQFAHAGDPQETIQAYIIAYFADPAIRYTDRQYCNLMYPEEQLPWNNQRWYGEVDRSEPAAAGSSTSFYNMPFSGGQSNAKNNLEFHSGSASAGDDPLFCKNIAYQIRFRLLVKNKHYEMENDPNSNAVFANSFYQTPMRLHNNNCLMSLSSNANATYVNQNPKERMVSISGGYWINRNYPVNMAAPTQPDVGFLFQAIMFAGQQQAADVNSKNFGTEVQPYREHMIPHSPAKGYTTPYPAAQDPWDEYQDEDSRNSSSVANFGVSFADLKMPFTCNVIPDALPAAFPQTFGKDAVTNWANNDWVTIGQCTNKNVVLAEKE